MDQKRTLGDCYSVRRCLPLIVGVDSKEGLMPGHGPSLMTPHICFRQCGSDFGLVGQHVVLTSCISAEEQYLYLLKIIFLWL